MGRKAYKTTVFRALASFSEKAGLAIGNIVDRPYRSNLVVEDYVKGVAAVAQDLSATSDTLTINVQKTILMYIDDVDKVQNKWDAAKEWAEEAGKRIGIAQDAYFLYEAINAADSIDDGDLGGTAGSPFTITVSNIVNVIAKINRKLDIQNVDMERKSRFWVISPQIYDVLWQYIAGKESLLGDKTGEYGNIGRYGGLELFLSNNLTATAVWTPASNTLDGETIVINSVTLTFRNTQGALAGSVNVCANTANTLTSLAASINAPGTSVDEATDAGFNALTGASLRTIQMFTAVATSTTLTIYGKGTSFLTVTTSQASSTWTKATQHSLAGVKKAIDMVVQLEPELGKDSMASTVSAGKRGMNVMPLTVFGLKTFNQGANEILDVQVASSTF